MSLAALLDAGGNPVIPNGLGTTLELTVVSSVTYVITSISAMGTTLTVTATAAAVQSANSFVEVWYDSTPDANPLNGTGYNDGTRILLASPTSSGSLSFVEQRNMDGSSQISPFDQFGANNYPGVSSIRSAGQAGTMAAVSNRNPAFFISAFQSFGLDTPNATPFTLTDPSALFVALAGGVAPSVSPSLGATNGVSGPDFQLQTDGTGSFAIPEPTTTILIALAACGLAVARIRRKARQ